MKPPDGPRWLTAAQVKVLHAESLSAFGGLDGVRDENLLGSALARPQHLFTYGGAPDLSALAAAYGGGIARNHPFLDGNKRAALLAMRAFLFLNGRGLNPDQLETVTTMEGVAAGSVDEVALAEWIRANSAPLTPRSTRLNGGQSVPHEIEGDRSSKARPRGATPSPPSALAAPSYACAGRGDACGRGRPSA